MIVEFAEAIAAIRTAPCSSEFQPMIDKLSDEDLVYILSTYDEWRGITLPPVAPDGPMNREDRYGVKAAMPLILIAVMLLVVFVVLTIVDIVS